MRKERKRLDLVLVERGLVPSRAKAQALILARQVRVDGACVDKPGTLISPFAHIQVLSLPRYVSRGGEKLEAALKAFGIDPTGKICLDIGASTGAVSYTHLTLPTIYSV